MAIFYNDKEITILDFNKRDKFSKDHPKLIQDLIKYNSIKEENIGNLGYIVREFLRSNPEIKRENFGNFYIKSGEELNTKKNKSFSDKLKYGRTIEDLLKISSEFCRIYIEKENKEIPINAAFNALFYLIFDKTFYYIQNLKNFLDKNNYTLSSSDEYLNFNIDFFEKENENIIRTYSFKTAQNQELLKQKLDIAKQLYDFNEAIIL